MDKYINVFSASDVAQAYIVKYALENANIPIQIENEFLQSALGMLPFDGSTAPKVCVPEPHVEQAKDIIASIITVEDTTPEAASSETLSEAMVLMHVKYDEFVEDEVHELGEAAAKLCKQYEGFVSVKQFEVKAADEFYILMHWENEHAYLACKQSPAWLMLMPQWSALQEDGDVTLNIKVLKHQSD
jgi:quinol monooxygenase YgiN